MAEGSRDMTPGPLTKRQSIAIYECHTRRMYQILAAKQRLCSASVDAAAGVKISPGYRCGNAVKAVSGSKCDISSVSIRRSHCNIIDTGITDIVGVKRRVKGALNQSNWTLA